MLKKDQEKRPVSHLDSLEATDSKRKGPVTPNPKGAWDFVTQKLFEERRGISLNESEALVELISLAGKILISPAASNDAPVSPSAINALLSQLTTLSTASAGGSASPLDTFLQHGDAKAVLEFASAVNTNTLARAKKPPTLDAAATAAVNRALAAITTSLIYSAVFMTLDDWDEFRSGVYDGHVVLAARCNRYLRFLADAFSKGDAKSPADATATDPDAPLRTRVDALLSRETEGNRDKFWILATGDPGLAPAGFPQDAWRDCGVSERELCMVEECFGFRLPEPLRVFYRTTNGLVTKAITVNPLQLVLTEHQSHPMFTEFFMKTRSFPINNPVAGGRWGEAWDVCFCGDGDNKNGYMVGQIEFFFLRDDVGSSPLMMTPYEMIAACERAIAAGKYNGTECIDLSEWRGESENKKEQPKLSDRVSKERLKGVAEVLGSMDFIQTRFGK